MKKKVDYPIIVTEALFIGKHRYTKLLALGEYCSLREINKHPLIITDGEFVPMKLPYIFEDEEDLRLKLYQDFFEKQ